MNTIKRSGVLLGLGLMLLMIVTRSSHAGDTFHLPDASIAVFFLAGFYIRHIGLFLLLCTAAVFSDYFAINYAGVSSFCVTVAYTALLPTYFVMWFAGRWCARHLQPQLRQLFRFGVIFFVATIAAFNISSGSFYLWSGYFDPNWAEYGQRIAAYLPAYLKGAFVYAIAAAIVHTAVNAMMANRISNKSETTK